MDFTATSSKRPYGKTISPMQPEVSHGGFLPRSEDQGFQPQTGFR